MSDGNLPARQQEWPDRLRSERMHVSKSHNSEAWREHHFTVRQLADMWAMSPETVRRLIENEPDVMRIGEGETRNKGRYFTYFIPESVARRVHSQACSNR